MVLGGGLLAALVALWRVAAERRHLDASADSTRDATELRRYTDLRTVRAELIACEDRCRELTEENEELADRLKRAPIALLASGLADLNGLGRWFDGFTEMIVASTSEKGGTLIYVNPAFCSALGRPKEELLGSAWRALLHPDDARRTRSVEASATYQRVTNFGNRYLHADGRWIQLVWNCDSYSLSGLTLCRVEIGE